MKFVLTVAGILLTVAGSGQSIQRVKAIFESGQVIITYDLAGGNAKQKYAVQIYGSHNNFSQPLKYVTGDVGNELNGGLGKKVIWDAANELITYSGQITFRVRAELGPLPIAFISPTQNKQLRRGRTTLIRWEGGVKDQNIRIEVYKGTEKIAHVGDAKNSGQFSWAIPKDFKKGTHYSLKITEGSQVVDSHPFSVKAKIPLLVKISPLVLGAVLIPVLAGGGESPPETDRLAAAPNPN